MSFRPQRNKPLPKGLVHGLTSIMFESALKPAERPEPPSKPEDTSSQLTQTSHKEAPNG